MVLKIPSHRPLVVGTLTSAQPLHRQLKAVRNSLIDVVEIRLDTFSELKAPIDKASRFAVHLLKQIRQATRRKILTTIRSAKEAGNHRSTVALPEGTRLKIFAACLLVSDLIDIEIRAASAATLTNEARKKKVGVIHSFHDFKNVPGESVLARWASLSRKLQGDIFKLAVTPRDEKDLEKFLWWGKDNLNGNRVLIAMGPVGLPSRYLGFTFGSVMTYGHLGSSVAPGQVYAPELAKVARLIYPDGKHKAH